jgi:hypothetical protein
MALTAGDKLGPYEILAPIGKGGMGDRLHRAGRGRLDAMVHAPPGSAWFHASSGYHAAGSPPLDQGAKTPITIVTNWEVTLKR